LIAQKSPDHHSITTASFVYTRRRKRLHRIDAGNGIYNSKD
jgi:hypothetical protein